jgi:flagellar hook-associated protein 1 FlgK
MGLTAAIQTAQSALRTTSAQTAITSRNVAGASDPGYSRKLALVTETANGAQTLAIRRASDKALYENMVEATSRAAAQQAVADGLNMLEATIGDPEHGHSPAALVGALNDSIQLYSASPSDPNLAQGVVTKAQDLANALKTASAVVQQVRSSADEGMAAGVADLNRLLADFERANAAVVIGTHAGADITDDLDARDKLLSQISELVGVRAVSRDANDMALYTDSGVTLFDVKARAVTFQATPALGPSQTGGAIFVDGVPVTGASATMPLNSGRLQGLAALRDEVAVTFQGQLDEVARGLIETFAEADQSVPATLPERPGLFTWTGAPAMPGAVLVKGLAGVISVNAGVDPAQGGSLARLRDGGISDPGNPAYVYNQSGAAGFSGRLTEFLGKLQAVRTFDAAVGLDTNASLGGFASSSVGWLEAARKEAVDTASYQTTLLGRASDALSHATGVNLDDEMTLLLELERSYQATSKLLVTIDDMIAGFIAGIR